MVKHLWLRIFHRLMLPISMFSEALILIELAMSQCSETGILDNFLKGDLISTPGIPNSHLISLLTTPETAFPKLDINSFSITSCPTTDPV
jgi:hypothetical protein